MNALWLITLAHVEENRRALQITWFSGELLEMLFCMMNMWESICSHIPAITRTQHPLSYPGYASSLFVYTSLKKYIYSNPFVQQLLLRSGYPSSNLIGPFVFLLCETEKIRRTGRKINKNKCVFSAQIFAVYVEAYIGSCCFLPALHRAWNSLCFFALSVERHLGIDYFAQ